MALLQFDDLIARYNERQSFLISDSGEKDFASKKLLTESKKFSYSSTYDIFLSHSYNDARIVKIIKELLEEGGRTVYVDWIEDDHLDRGKVTAETAAVLRARMDRCSSLIYLTSRAASNSRWMPWELGYMNAKTNRVSVAPIIEKDEKFIGQEYLGLYPYLDLTNDNFYIHNKVSEWVTFSDWLLGMNPSEHL